MIRVVAAVVIVGDRVLLADRPADKPPAGWEFPGGKVEAGESLFHALKRELREELKWEVLPLGTIWRLRRPNLVIDFIRALPVPGSDPVPQEHQHCFWVPISPEPPSQLLANDWEFWQFLFGRVK